MVYKNVKALNKKLTKISEEEKAMSSRLTKALKRNVKRGKGKYATARDQELMFGY